MKCDLYFDTNKKMYCILIPIELPNLEPLFELEEGYTREKLKSYLDSNLKTEKVFLILDWWNTNRYIKRKLPQIFNLNLYNGASNIERSCKIIPEEFKYLTKIEVKYLDSNSKRFFSLRLDKFQIRSFAYDYLLLKMIW